MLMDLQGNDLERLLNVPECWDYPVWSSTGILGYGPYERYFYNRMEYYLMTQEDTQVIERSSNSDPYGPIAANAGGLAWSPEGNSIAYVNAESVIVIDFIDGTEEDIFITGVQGSQPNWSPN